jgi:hypothetical protein
MEDAPREPGDDEPIDVVTTVGPLDPVVALLREFLHRSGALRAVALMEQAPGEEPALVDCARLAPIEVVRDGRRVVLPHAVELDVPDPDVPDVRQLPPFDVTPETGEIATMIGGLEHYAEAVIGLTRRIGPRDVVVATWATTTHDVPLSISARGKDPLIIVLGEEQYEMDPGWPPPVRAL